MKTPPFPIWVWAFPGIGLLRTVAFTLLGGWDQSAPGTFVGVLLALSFTGAGSLLILKGRPQPAPVRLGGAFLLIASAFVPEHTLLATGASPMRALALLQPVYFEPVFVWAFAAVFPRPEPLRSVGPLAGRMTYLGVAAGTLLLALGAAAHLAAGSWNDSSLESASHRVAWLVIYLLNGGALVHIAYRSRRVRRPERRRVSLFALGILVGSAPSIVGSLILLLSPRLLATVRANALYVGAFRLVSYAGLIAVPLITMHAVLRSRVLGLREVARSSIRTILARQMAYAMIGIPLVLLGVLLLGAERYGYRFPRGLLVGAAGVASGMGVLGLLQRRRILGFVDRQFFPEHERIDEALESLRSEIASTPSQAELAGTIRVGLQEAMELSGAFLMALDRPRAELRAVRGEARPLPLSGAALAELESRRVLDLSGRAYRSNPAMDAWVQETGIELLVAVRSGTRLGAIGAGVKRSGMPFVRYDQWRLTQIAETTGTTLERLQAGLDAALVPPGASVTGFDCVTCGVVLATPRESCNACGSLVEPSALPLVVAGKLRLVRRIGAGGFGVVYHAEDLDLHRSVALKALTRRSNEDTVALLTEARFMASLNHPALATIFGIEVAGNIPVLVLELFEDGSLEDRLRYGALSWDSAVDMAIELADGLGYLHDRQMLHGDVKPSNIGLTDSGRAKLIDFGLTRFISCDNSEPRSSLSGQAARGIGAFGGRPGTPAYLPPEANSLNTFETRDDLWALAVTVYEAIAGRHPYSNADGRIPLAHLVVAPATVVPMPAPDCPSAIVALFADALAKDPARRPRTATEFADRLRAARAPSLS